MVKSTEGPKWRRSRKVARQPSRSAPGSGKQDSLQTKQKRKEKETERPKKLKWLIKKLKQVYLQKTVMLIETEICQ